LSIDKPCEVAHINFGWVGSAVLTFIGYKQISEVYLKIVIFANKEGGGGGRGS